MKEILKWVGGLVVVLLIYWVFCGPADMGPGRTEGGGTGRTTPQYFIDGRDAEATPPLTVMNVNVWDSMDRTRVVCTLRHGAEVELLRSEFKESENRYYHEIRSGRCRGWLPRDFVSQIKHDPIGDQM